MKKYYLYRKPIKEFKGIWSLDDEFDSIEEAKATMIDNAKRASWKIWKIEEVYDFYEETKSIVPGL